MSAEETPEVVTPSFSVVKGAASDEDVAALAVVLTALRRARGNPHAPDAKALVGGWTSYWHNLRHTSLPGRDAWRSTFRR